MPQLGHMHHMRHITYKLVTSIFTLISRSLSVPKTKVMVVSAVPAPAVGFTCNGNPVEQVPTFKYLGLHSINQAPLRTLSHQSKRELVALGRLQRGNTVNLFTPHADTMRTARPSGGLEVRYRLSEFHAHMTSLHK